MYVEELQDAACDSCGIEPKNSVVGVWETEKDFSRDDHPRYNAPETYCLACLLTEDVEIENLEEIAFEGGDIHVERHSDSVSVVSSNSLGTTVHTFSLESIKRERITRGNPNKAAPGHGGFYYEDTLSSDRAEVDVEEPRYKRSAARSNYFRELAEKELEK